MAASQVKLLHSNLSRAFNDAAAPLLRRAGVSVLDMYTESSAHPEASPDGAQQAPRRVNPRHSITAVRRVSQACTTPAPSRAATHSACCGSCCQAAEERRAHVSRDEIRASARGRGGEREEALRETPRTLLSLDTARLHTLATAACEHVECEHEPR